MAICLMFSILSLSAGQALKTIYHFLTQNQIRPKIVAVHPSDSDVGKLLISTKFELYSHHTGSNKRGWHHQSTRDRDRSTAVCTGCCDVVKNCLLHKLVVIVMISPACVWLTASQLSYDAWLENKLTEITVHGCSDCVPCHALLLYRGRFRFNACFVFS